MQKPVWQQRKCIAGRLKMNGYLINWCDGSAPARAQRFALSLRDVIGIALTAQNNRFVRLL